LEVAEVKLEAITLPHFDGEEVVVILLGLLEGSVMGKKCLGYLLKTVHQTQWQGIN